MNNITRLMNAFNAIESKVTDIKVINLTTSDGFPICSKYFESKNFDEDKLSAASSSMAALSVAASKQLIGSNFSSTIIETDNGSMLLVNTKYDQKDCILCFVTGNLHQIGHVRFFAFKLAEFINNS